MKIIENEIGTTLILGKIEMFFGNRNSSIEAIRTKFPFFNISEIKQVHGNHIINAHDNQILEADAHFTTEQNNALVIRAADCLPILACFKDPELVLGIHAGWRGIESRIIEEACRKLKSIHPNIKSNFAAIGPHIRLNSFEVGGEVVERLKSTTTIPANSFSHPLLNGKFLLSLEILASSQLISCGFRAEQIFTLKQDTKLDPNFHSYRRDKEAAGRQISFCVISEQ